MITRTPPLVLSLFGAVALAVAAPVTAHADHALLHLEPQGPAAVHFPDDFPALTDHEWGFELGGFGGIARGHPIDRPPVIFVHGNTADHGDWYPVRDDFVAAGWSEQELWALSYNGLGANVSSTEARPNPQAEDERAAMGHDGLSRSTYNEVNVPDLDDFIRAVQDYTGSDGFSLVGHSLGVTIARRTMHLHPDLADDVVAFVGIAGANHGTSLCPPGSQPLLVSCDEIATGTEWLGELNGPGGSLETYGDTAWMTIRDGSGLGDNAFLTALYADSPMLAGAENLDYPQADHNELRLREDIVATYRTFIEDAVEALPAADEGPPATGPFDDEGSDEPGSEPPVVRPDDVPADGTDVPGEEPLGNETTLPATGPPSPVGPAALALLLLLAAPRAARAG